MVLIVMAVRDSAVGAYLRPFYAPSVGAAMRSFYDEVNRKDSEMFRHPDDYELFELGEFEEVSAVFSMKSVPRSVCRAKEVLDISVT